MVDLDEILRLGLGAQDLFEYDTLGNLGHRQIAELENDACVCIVYLEDEDTQWEAFQRKVSVEIDRTGVFKVFRAKNPSEFLSLVAEHKPHIALVDLLANGVNVGQRYMQDIVKRSLSTRVIVYSAYLNAHQGPTARAGAAAGLPHHFIDKNDEPKSLKDVFLRQFDISLAQRVIGAGLEEVEEQIGLSQGLSDVFHSFKNDVHAIGEHSKPLGGHMIYYFGGRFPRIFAYLWHWFSIRRGWCANKKNPLFLSSNVGSCQASMDRVCRDIQNLKDVMGYSPVETDLRALVEEVYAAHSTEIADERLNVSVVPGEEVPLCYLDSEALKLVLDNLLINSMDATTDGGSIRLEYGLKNDGRTDYVEIVHADNGSGVPIVSILTKLQRKRQWREAVGGYLCERDAEMALRIDADDESQGRGVAYIDNVELWDFMTARGVSTKGNESVEAGKRRGTGFGCDIVAKSIEAHREAGWGGAGLWIETFGEKGCTKVLTEDGYRYSDATLFADDFFRREGRNRNYGTAFVIKLPFVRCEG